MGKERENTEGQGIPSLTGDALSSFKTFRDLNPSQQLAVGQRVILFEVEMLRICDGRWNSSNWHEVWDELVDTYSRNPDSATADIHREFKNETGLSPSVYLERPVKKIFQLKQCGLNSITEFNRYVNRARNLGGEDLAPTTGTRSTRQQSSSTFGGQTKYFSPKTKTRP